MLAIHPFLEPPPRDPVTARSEVALSFLIVFSITDGSNETDIPKQEGAAAVARRDTTET